MQNKVNQFKQLSQEFADRKGYEVEFTDIPTKHTSSFRATFLKGYTIISHLAKPRLSNDIVSEDLIMSKSVTKRNNGELIRLFKFKAPEYYAVFQACQWILDKELK